MATAGSMAAATEAAAPLEKLTGYGINDLRDVMDGRMPLCHLECVYVSMRSAMHAVDTYSPDEISEARRCRLRDLVRQGYIRFDAWPVMLKDRLPHRQRWNEIVARA